MREACPTCLGKEISSHDSSIAHYICLSCGHIWSRSISAGLKQLQYYSQLSGRNFIADSACSRKMVDRLNDLSPLLFDGMRVLEIGCAEGELGRRIKEIANVEYVGIELSEDSVAAMKFLDRVSRSPATELRDEPFDLILSFHVLEHIPDIRAEVRHWRRLLKLSGSLVMEVPNEAGHPLLSWDANVEHLHQFTTTSLSSLLDHAGFSIRKLSASHFESTSYPDSLRVQACLRLDVQERRDRLIARFRSVLPGPFIVYGIGGDFRNYVAPLLPELQIVALVDSDTSRYGENIAIFQIEEFNMEKFSGMPILVTSLRHKADITALLQKQGVSSQAIYGLDSILE